MGVAVELTETTEENARENDDEKNNDKEEGEIVEDDFEDIISSDEELSMRKRIEELEARNLELEKIANISGIYSCDFSKKDLGYPSERYKNGSLALDLSDSEDYGTKKTYTTKRIKSASSKAAATAAAASAAATRRNRYKDLSPVLYKSFRKRSQSPNYIGRSLRDYSKTRKRKHEKIKNRIPRKARDRSKKRSRLDYTSSEEEFCSLDRDELRMALRHDLRAATNPQGNLRNLIKDTTRTLDERKEEESCVTIEIKDDPDKGDNSSDDSVSLEEQELRLIALKSAIVKKHMARKKRKEIDEKKPYSPTDFLQPMGNTEENDTISPQLFLENDACNSMDISPIPSPDNLNEDYTDKSVDMDLVDSSNSSSPIFVGQQKWTPINEIPLPSDRKYETENHVSSQFQKIISPMPIRLQQSGVPSIKPPRCVINIDEDYDDDDETIEIQSNEASSPEPIDEEANALRALLLAQKNSPKFNKDKDLRGAKKPAPPEIVENVPEKMLGILSIVEGPAHKTEEILKEAVKRLQKKSPDIHCHNSLSSDQSEITNHQQLDDIRLHSPEMFEQSSVVAEPPTIKTSPIGFNISVKCSGTKENISMRQGSRPNNIQIIPTVVIPRASRKSPLTEIVEMDNVKPKIPTTEIISKPEAPVIIDPPPKTPPVKQMVPTLKALQLKTLNLISAGKLLNPNKTIATKLLNKAIHQNVTQTKRKTLSLQNAAVKRTKTSISSRLITKFDMPPVKRLVIRVRGTSETESDDLNDDGTASLINNCKISPDDDYDMASPMSLPMESPRDSPLTIVPSATTHSTTKKAVVAAAPANDVCQNGGGGGGGSGVVVVTSDPLPPTDKFTTPKKSNDAFQAQLDEFLKNARSKVDLIKKETATITPTKIITASPLPPRINVTPLAVRHLPPSSQLEYRRLVNRMQTLEKQKQARSKIFPPTIDKSFKVTIKNDIAAPLKPLATNTNDPLLAKLKSSEEKPMIGQLAKTNEIKRVIQNEMIVSPEKPKEPVKLDAVIKPKVIAKLPQSELISKQIITTTTNKVINKLDSKSDTAANTRLNTEPQSISTLEIDSSKMKTLAITKKKTVPKEKPKKKIVPLKCKPRSLSECEKDYKETSSSLVENISKTIDLVVSAKEEKQAKFILENELKELHEKMLTIEYKIKLRNLKISKIYPEISSSHKTIMELKSRTSQLEECSENMGNSLKAGKNKLQYSDQKHKIMELSKRLSAEIKNLKNLKISNCKKEKIVEKENSILKCEMIDRSVQVDFLLCSKMNDEQNNTTEHNNNSIKKNDADADDNNGEESSCSLSECCDTQNVQNSLELIDSEKLDDSFEPIEENCRDYCAGVENDVDKEINVILDLKSFDVARNESEEALDKLEKNENEADNVANVTKYISPLNFSNDKEHINPHGVICPYQLMGQCDDKECKFEHLNNST